MNHHPLVDDEAVEKKGLCTDQDFDLYQGLEDTIEAQECFDEFPTFSSEAPAEPLQWPLSETFEALIFSIANLK